MKLIDILLVLFYGIVFLFLGNFIVQRSKDGLYRKWFMKGLWAKLGGSLMFCLAYTYYFDYGGDTKAYFKFSQVITEALWEKPLEFDNLLSRNLNNVSSRSYDAIRSAGHKAPKEYYVVNFAAIFNFFTFQSYFATSLFFAFLSYLGVWRMFQLFIKYYPQLEKQMAIAILFLPSVVFWGSGIMKDSLIIGFLGWFLFYADRLISSGFTTVRGWVMVLSTGYFMAIIKPYVLFSILPAILLWRSLYLRDRIRNQYLRSLVLPVAIVAGLLGVTYSLQKLGEINPQYALENFFETASSMQGWHYVEGENTSEEHGRGSSYSLGNYETTWDGILRVFPAAVNVTLFRPYPWEVKTGAMALAMLESLILLFFTVRILVFRVNPFKAINFIGQDSFLLMCVVFSIVFAFAVGFSSYNFGALSRYKIPCMPFYVAALFILNYKVEKLRKLRLYGKYQSNLRILAKT